MQRCTDPHGGLFGVGFYMCYLECEGKRGVDLAMLPSFLITSQSWFCPFGCLFILCCFSAHCWCFSSSLLFSQLFVQQCYFSYFIFHIPVINLLFGLFFFFFFFYCQSSFSVSYFSSHTSSSPPTPHTSSSPPTPHTLPTISLSCRFCLIAWGALIARSQPPYPASFSPIRSSHLPHCAVINITVIRGFLLYPFLFHCGYL